MALGYNDRQRLLGLSENENADMDNLVEAPEFQQFQNAQDSSEEMPVLAQPERQFAQSTALENSGSVAPINEESDIPVQTRVPAATDISAQIKTRSDSSSQAQYNPQTGEAPDLMDQYRKLMDQRKTELEGARKAEMLQNMLSGINSNVGLIIGGNAAKNSGAAVNAPQLAKLDKIDYSGNVDRQLNPELEGMMEQYKMLQQEKQAAANRKIQEDQLAISRQGLDIKRMLADKKAGAGSLSLTEGQKAVDRDYAKQYNQFTGKGRENAVHAINQLEKMAEELEGDSGLFELGGGRISALGDTFRSRTAIRRRDSTRNFANTTLRELFPGALSDAEREAAAKEYYNDALSNEDNAKIIRDKIGQLKNALQSETDKALYFQQNKSLSGYDDVLRTNTRNDETTPNIDNSGATDRSISKKLYSPSRNKTRIIYSDGTEEVVDGRQ